MAAFWWTRNREHSAKDLDRDRAHARQGADCFTTEKTVPSRCSDNVERYVRLCQEAVGLPVTGVVDKATLHMMRGGSVM
ncbi:peptidoglycan-binding protein [Streptomyces sp. NPDC093088]|uniref:peptidoglycan-binding protein n=1 Tax=Streptomyces sp. NPDC093088 TaxID=3366023 RepID=UPI003821F256